VLPFKGALTENKFLFSKFEILILLYYFLIDIMFNSSDLLNLYTQSIIDKINKNKKKGILICNLKSEHIKNYKEIEIILDMNNYKPIIYSKLDTLENQMKFGKDNSINFILIIRNNNSITIRDFIKFKEKTNFYFIYINNLQSNHYINLDEI
tara:strand:+ start:557 stop:1012 length:456 start_codon:yes stop_codon:yes gene_type:complete